MINVKIKKLNKELKTPSYAHPGDAGIDLYSAETKILPSMHRALVPTGIQMAIPKGYEGQVRPKSGLAINHGLSIVNTPGTVDAGYRGEVGVIAINLSEKTIIIEKGQKIAQMIFNKIETAKLTEVDDLEETSRGKGGFGSTGVK